MEQIGALFRNETAVDIGIITSLLMPTESLWRKATVLFRPETASGMDIAGPFMVVAQPSDLMIGYSLVYIAALIALALFLFTRRDI